METKKRRAGDLMRQDIRRTAEMFVRFTDGTGRTLHAVEDTPESRRMLDRMAAHLLAKPNVESIAVEVVTGRTAGYQRSR